MFYRLNDEGSVLDWSEVKYSDDCLFTEKEIVTAWNGLTYISGEEPQEPQELLEARIEKELLDAVQHHLDAKAQELLYDSCLSVCSYIDSGNIAISSSSVGLSRVPALISARVS